jgi:protein associated with RNAse G/E
MFTESIIPIDTVKSVLQMYKKNGNILPISSTNNTVKCLDFDMDTVVFKSKPRSSINLADVNPYNKTQFEVMNMV